VYVWEVDVLIGQHILVIILLLYLLLATNCFIFHVDVIIGSLSLIYLVNQSFYGVDKVSD
jgi:hypothetical protein